jgi:hypothetical protein
LRKALAQKEADCAELRERVKLHEALMRRRTMSPQMDGSHIAEVELIKVKEQIADLTRQLDDSQKRVKELEKKHKISTHYLAQSANKIESLLRENKTESGITERYEQYILGELKKAEAQLNEPIHLGMFYNDEEGIKTIYILDKDGNETDRVVKAECLLKRISGYFKRAKSAEAQLEEARKALYAADKFITNGVELGFIRMPDEDVPDPAKLTPGIVKAALADLAGKEK